MNPRHRWWGFAVALVLLASAFGFVLLREDPKKDGPRLVVVRRTNEWGNNVVRFPLAVPPKRREVLLDAKLAIESVEQAPTWDSQGNPLFKVTREPEEFGVVAPLTGSTWRLRVLTPLQLNAPAGVLERIKLSWKYRTLPWHLRVFAARKAQWIESEPITNAVASTAEPPRKRPSPKELAVMGPGFPLGVGVRTCQ